MMSPGTPGLGHVARFTIWIFRGMSEHVVRAPWLAVIWKEG